MEEIRAVEMGVDLEEDGISEEVQAGGYKSNFIRAFVAVN